MEALQENITKRLDKEGRVSSTLLEVGLDIVPYNLIFFPTIFLNLDFFPKCLDPLPSISTRTQ